MSVFTIVIDLAKELYPVVKDAVNNHAADLAELRQKADGALDALFAKASTLRASRYAQDKAAIDAAVSDANQT